MDATATLTAEPPGAAAAPPAFVPPMRATAQRRLGEALVERGLLTPLQLDQALLLQRVWQKRLGDVLLDMGWVDAPQLYRVIAEQLRLPFVDLLDEPPDANLLDPGEADRYVAEQTVPWRRQKGALVYVTADPVAARSRLRKRHAGYGGAFALAVVAPFDLPWTLQGLRRTPAATAAEQALRSTRPSPGLSSAVCTALVFGLAMLVLLAVLPPAIVTGTVIALAACGLAGEILAMLRALRQRRPAAEPPPLASDDLPRYAVAVPVLGNGRDLAAFAEALRQIDYPADRLKIVLLLDQTNSAAIAAARAVGLESGCDILRLRQRLDARTAQTAALEVLRGMDAELVAVLPLHDLPAADQLRRAAARFAAGGPVLALVAAQPAPRASAGWLAKAETLQAVRDIALPALLRSPACTAAALHLRRRALDSLSAADCPIGSFDRLALELDAEGYRAECMAGAAGARARTGWRSWLIARATRLADAAIAGLPLAYPRRGRPAAATLTRLALATAPLRPLVRALTVGLLALVALAWPLLPSLGLGPSDRGMLTGILALETLLALALLRLPAMLADRTARAGTVQHPIAATLALWALEAVAGLLALGLLGNRMGHGMQRGFLHAGRGVDTHRLQRGFLRR